MAISKRAFGDGATLYRLENKQGISAEILDFGGTLVSLSVPDRAGVFADVTLGYDDLASYRSRKYFLGALVGRCANRMANGCFTLDGKDYSLARNDGGKHHLHGGACGFDQRLFHAALVETADGSSLRLSRMSPDGEDGYPGNLTVNVTYTLTEQNALRIDYDARSDAPTLCNLTNHAYFNLAGHDVGDILGHRLQVFADQFTETDAESIPTGRVLSVDGTAMDFRTPHLVGERIDADEQPLHFGHGYDHNFVLRKGETRLRPAAMLHDPASGRTMTCLTTSPGIQVYSGNYIDGTQTGKGGCCYGRRSGLALETQFAPDAVRHPAWESPVLRPGERCQHTTIYRFTVE